LQATNAKLNQTSPIQVAEDSNLIVWTTSYTIRYLEKINNSLQYLTESSVAAGSNNGNRYRSKNVKHLKGDFVKIESFQKNYRPFYKEFKKWPTLNLSARLTNSPFDTKSDCDRKHKKSSKLYFSKLDSRTTAVTATNNTVADNTVNSESNGGKFNRMTRKARNAKTIKCIKDTAVKDNSNVNAHCDDDCYEQNIKQCGYCEICRVEYDVLKVHLKTDEHLNFIKNDTNFLSLDKLISSGANLETFLKLNSEPLPKKETIFLENKNLPKRHLVSSNNKGMKKVANKSVTRDSEMRELLETQEKLLNGYAELNDLKLSRNLRSTFATSEKVKNIKIEKSKTKNCRSIGDDEDGESISQCKSIRLRRQSTTMRRINYVEPKDTVVEYDSDEESEVNTAKPKVDKSKIKLYGVRWRPPRGSSQEKSTSVVKTTPLVRE
jgi:DBF zinc finger